ncbi:hypothetical protein [Streptomyces mirabilis]|uniref:hypothetical protein n=1 Tax=Streptomyces mirabilis TaxID=68239 RepID=UPI00331BDE57
MPDRTVSHGEQLGRAKVELDRTSVQIGPTGKKLLPLTVKNAAPAPAGTGHAH